jgi:hypothetical protein
MLRVDRLAGRSNPVMALILEPARDIKNKSDDGLIFLRGLRLRFIPERGKFTIAEIDGERQVPAGHVKD